MKLTTLHRITLYCFSLLFLPLVLASPQDKPLKIMPLGNSITYDERIIDGRSVGEKCGYRYRLYQLLTAEGYTFDFIGSESSGSSYLPLAYTDNAGFPGITAAQMLTLLETGVNPVTGLCELSPCPRNYLSFYEPDIILLHIGTNDLTDSASALGTVTSVSKILDLVDAYESSADKKVPVFLARIINRGGTSSSGNHRPTSYFNQLLANMVALRGPDLVRIVNMETDASINYRYTTLFGDMYDLRHPAPSGYTKMGNLWFSSLEAYNYTAPIVSDIPDQTRIEETPFATINLNDYVFDPQEPDANITWGYSTTGSNLTVSISAAKIATITINNPDWYGEQTVTFTAYDSGNGSVPLSASDNVKFIVTNKNDAPVLSNLEITSINYTEGQGSVLVTSSITVTDIDNDYLQAATVSIAGGFKSEEDVLGIVNQGGITGNYNQSTGILSLSGNATKANYQSALRSVTYTNTNTDNPSTSSRVITFRVNDGTDFSDYAVRPLSITAVNDAPVLGNIEGSPLLFTEDQAAINITQDITITDVDNDSIVSGTVRVSSNYLASEDTLIFLPLHGITGTWNDITGTMTLTGATTKANFQAALRSVKYQNTNKNNPSTATRVVSFSINDGEKNSNTITRSITIVAVNDPPSAKNVVVNGSKTIFSLNTLSYTFIDPENMSQGTPIITWKRAKLENKSDSAIISGATTTQYLLQYADGGYIKATVRPVDNEGLAATLDYSSPWYKVNSAPVANNVSIGGAVAIGQTDTILFDYFDVDLDVADPANHKYFWYRANNASGSGKTLIGSTKTYTITSSENSKYISCAIAPAALTGSLIGDTVQTPWYGPISNLPSATISGTDTLCPGETASIRIALTGASPWSVTYTINNINPVIIPKIVSSDTTLITNKIGTYRLTKVSDAKYNNGSVNGTAVITMHDTVKVTLAAVGVTSICDDGVTTATLRADFTGTAPWNFTLRNNATDTVYTNVTQDPINLTTKKQGLYSIPTLRDKYCSALTGSKDTITVAFKPSPTATIAGVDTVCPGDTARLTVALTKGTAPWGFTYSVNGTGTYSVTGIIKNSYTLKVFSQGTYKITSLTDAICTGKGTGEGKVVHRPVPNAFLSGGGTVCEGTGATLKTDLTGTGPWKFSYKRGSTTIDTLENITTSPRFISTKTAGTYTLGMVQDKYCKGTVSGSATVSVIAAPVVDISGLLQTYSVESNAVPVYGTPPGGNFSGSGLIERNDTMFFLPSWAGVPNSPHKITYTYQDPISGCFGKDTVMVNVLAVDATIKFPEDKTLFCFNDKPFKIEGQNVFGDTGTFVISGGIGLTDNHDNTATIDPSKLTGGEYVVSYTYEKDNSPIIKHETFTIEYVNPIWFVGFNQNTYCSNQSALKLNGNMAQGIFYGNAVSGNIINGFYFVPSLAPIGTDTIFYKYTTTQGCSRSVYEAVTINEAPQISFTVLDTCVSGETGDSTIFVNTTTSTDEITSWLWNFDDIGSGIYNTSTLKNPTHLYTSSGRKYVSLTANTDKSCSSTKEIRLNFGDKPNSDFHWETECYGDGSPIGFIDQSSLSVGEIDTYKWKIYTGEGYDSLMTKNPEYSFVQPGDYRINLEVKTNYGCTDTVSKIYHLRPTFRLSESAYTEDFETGTNGWASHSNGSLTNSWEFGQPSEGFIGAASGINTWYTNITNSLTENSWISSPCFDFSGTKKPMIKFDMWRIFDERRDGAVLQYRVNNEDTWQNIGDLDDGKNWYNEYSIQGKPGNQSIGWSNLKDTKWTEARHHLNGLAGLTDVQFRIAYGSNGTGTSNEGIAIDNVGIWEREKIVLLEHFTNSTDLASKDANLLIWDAVNKLNGDVLDIQYHTAFPGTDPFNGHNPAVPNARVFYYGVLAVPYTFLDGGAGAEHRYDYDLKPLDNNDINLQSLTDPDFSISIHSDIQGNTLNVSATLTAEKAIPASELTLHTIVIEREITAIEGDNGETEFRNTVKAMLPGASGTYIYKNWAAGSTEHVGFTWNISNVFDTDELRVVVFVQDEATRKVYQAAVDKFDFVSGTGDEIINGQEFKCGIFPNPASDYTRVRFNQPCTTHLKLEVFDGSGRLTTTKIIEPFIEEFYLDTYHLSKGLYFIRITDNNRVNQVLKLLISK
ncbi:MAG: Omp28-related outer membrane protein [Bacteroidales bacterium]|nr:Omp28-related outer membrane protein [Bacteroidales bacterium]